MAKKKLKSLFSFGDKKGAGKIFSAVSPQAALNLVIIIAAVAAAIMVFRLMDRYITSKAFVFGNGAALELVDVPPWVNKTLKQKIYNAALSMGDDFALDEKAAKVLQEKIAAQVSWLANPQVQISHKSFRVRGNWRKPVGLIKTGTDTKFYVDADLAVMDFVPMPNFPVVTIHGIKKYASAPEPGEQLLEQEDLAAAMAILVKLDLMDKIVSRRRPLLFEIDSIDVSNFNGRMSNKFPHIVLFTKDNTQIVWGAELDNWHRHLEASDEQKLGKLYSFYKENKTLSGKVQFINLRDPQQVIQPIDKP